MVYRSYPYAPLMSFCSGLTAFGALLFFCFGILSVLNLSLIWKLTGVLEIAFAAFLFFIVYKKKIPNKAEEISKKNIETKVIYALQYCRVNPDAYDEIAFINKNFADKYERNEEGKIVKKK